MLFTVSVIIIVSQIYLDLKIPEYMSNITIAIESHETHDVIVKYGAEMGVCAIVSLFLAIITGILIANIAASLCSTIRTKMYTKIQKCYPQDIADMSAATLVTRSTNDVTQVQNFVSRALLIVVRSPILAIWAILKISGSNWQWTLSTIIGVLLLVIVIGLVMWVVMKYVTKVPWLTDELNSSTRENLMGIRVIRAYNAEKFQENKFSNSSEKLLYNNLKSNRYMSPLSPISTAITNFLILSIYIIGANLIISAGTEDMKLVLFSDMIVFSSYVLQVLSAFMLLTGIIRQYPRSRVSSKRVEELIRMEPSITEGTFDGDTEETGTVEFRDVSFAYPGSSELLHDISFKVNSGETIAIIGSSGSGKTTLVNLIPRFYEANAGEIIVDGVNVKEYTRRNLNSKIGFISQNNIIFSGTVEYNVNYGETSKFRTREDVMNALRIAQADSFVNALPKGMDTEISQYGKNLSGGQKQRISIARAVCKNPEIMIFDDSFSALDLKTDSLLRSELRKNCKDATKIIVAQRISTVMEANLIIVLDKGGIVGKGTHDELLENCQIYRDIAVSQMMVIE